MSIPHNGDVVLNSSGDPLVIADVGDRRPLIYGVATVELVIVTVVVALRLASRPLGGIPYWWDDWLIIPSYIGFVAAIAALFWFVIRDDGGRYVGPVTFQELGDASKIIFTWELVFAVKFCTVKLSILAFYWRVFAKGGSATRWTIRALMVLVVAWVVMNLLFVLLQCTPVRSLWDKTVQGECRINEIVWTLVVQVVNLATDLFMLALPIILSLRLHTSWITKLALGGVFAFGFLVTVFSILRIKVLADVNRQDPLLNFTNGWFLIPYVLLTMSENASLIITACLPTLRPLLARTWSGLSFGPSKQISHPAVEAGEETPNRRRPAAPYSSPWSARIWGVEITRTDRNDIYVLNAETYIEHIAHEPTRDGSGRSIRSTAKSEQVSMNS